MPNTIRPRNLKHSWAMIVLLSAAVALSGCTASVNLTIAADDVATLGAKALSEQWNAEATMDCGTKSVPSKEGTTVDCVAFNPNSGLDYPAVVTLSKIDGSKYSVSVETGPAKVPESDGEKTASTDTPTVPGESLAKLAGGALAKELGYQPEMDCGTEPIAIYLGAKIECVATGDDGLDYRANILVTEVSATNYNIDVDMLAAPLN